MIIKQNEINTVMAYYFSKIPHSQTPVPCLKGMNLVRHA